MNVVSGVSKRVWLLLYSEGGWWSVAEIRKTLEANGRDVGALAQTLNNMRVSGFLEFRDELDFQLERRLRYGVTKKCKVPRGVKLEEIEATLALCVQLKAA